jgi:hypothetical protein
MSRSSPLRRWALALLLLSVPLALFGAPVCQSERCPMSAARRAACRATGLDCCRNQSGSVSHAPVHALAPAPATAAGGTPDLGAEDQPAGTASSSQLDAAPAVIQGVGLFTLLAVFRI